MHSGGKPFWTDEEDAVLHALRDRKSASLIGEMLKRTRAAVCGRMFRIGLSRPKGLMPDMVKPRPQKPLSAIPVKRIPTPVPKLKPNPKPPQPLPLEAVWLPLNGCKPVPIVDLEPRHCRWPVEGGSCGADNGGEHVYCETHRAVACTRPTPLKLFGQVATLSR